MHPIRTLKARHRVRRGARRLDAYAANTNRVDDDWREQVDVERLDTRYPLDCVLGQVLGGFYFDEIGLTRWGAFTHGFLAVYPDEVTYADLDAAWRRELTR